MKKIKVLVFPKGSNPYQDALYAELTRNDQYSFEYINLSALVFVTLPLLFIYKRLIGCKIFHLHWLAFSLQKKFLFSKHISYLYSFICLFTIKLCGYKIVWTAHNVLPHEQQTINDRQVGRFLSRLAHSKIVHSKDTIIQMQGLNYDIKNISVIPHGSYIGLYDNVIPKVTARQKFGLVDNDFVILFFGAIRPYKGLEDLLTVFTSLPESTKLLIGGNCNDHQIIKLIDQHPCNKQIIFCNKYIDDAEVQLFFNACDVVCLPFKSITTSGSALLALSFSKPIVAPKIGSLSDLPETVGFFYKHDGLKSELNKALVADLNIKSQAAFEYACELSWNKIAQKTAKIYGDL